MSNTSRGWIFDLVNAISNDLSITNHLHEALYGVEANISELDPDDPIEVREELERLRDGYLKLIKMSLETRRSKMAYLKDNAVIYNKMMWCPLKHAIESYMETMEVWQATMSDESYKHMMESTSILSGVLSMFLGVELEVCARCLADSLALAKD